MENTDPAQDAKRPCGGHRRGLLPGLAGLWAKRRKFRGFGLLLFYCHMLMLFAFMARKYGLGGHSAYSALVSVSSALVWVQFGLTTFSLFLPRCFHAAMLIGAAQATYATFTFVSASLSDMPGMAVPPGGFAVWLLAVAGLALLLVLSWLRRASGGAAKAPAR